MNGVFKKIEIELVCQSIFVLLDVYFSLINKCELHTLNIEAISLFATDAIVHI